MKKLIVLTGIVAALIGSAALAKRMYVANCPTTHGFSGSWWGDNRETQEDAQRDADAHNKQNPGHSAFVFGRDIP